MFYTQSTSTAISGCFCLFFCLLWFMLINYYQFPLYQSIVIGFCFDRWCDLRNSGCPVRIRDWLLCWSLVLSCIGCRPVQIRNWLCVPVQIRDWLCVEEDRMKTVQTQCTLYMMVADWLCSYSWSWRWQYWLWLFFCLAAWLSWNATIICAVSILHMWKKLHFALPPHTRENVHHSITDSLIWRTGLTQWLECRTRDQKVVCSSPGSSGRMFFSMANFLSWLHVPMPCST